LKATYKTSTDEHIVSYLGS